METEYQMIVMALRRVEERLGAQPRDRASLQAEVSRLKERMATLEGRLSEIEAQLNEE